MSLDFQLTAIPNWETECREPDPEHEGKLRYKPVTTAIIFATMVVGIGHITEKNYIEFYMRLSASDAVSPWPDRGFPIELEDIRKHIGLRTNVSQETRAHWVKRTFEGTEREIRYRINRDEKQAA